MSLDYEAFVKMLHVNRHRLDDELEVQSDIFHQIGEQLAYAGARESDAKDRLDTCEAELYLDLTNKASTAKMTKDQAQATIQLDPFRVKAFRAHQATKTEKSNWQSLYDSWKARGFDLKTLGQLYTDQYFAIDSAGRAVPREDRTARRQQEAVEQRPRRRAVG